MLLETGKYYSRIAAILLGVLLLVTIAQPADAKLTKNSIITGKLIDAETGDPIVGGAVQIENTTVGALADINGNFVIRNLPSDTLNLIIQCVGYAKTRIENVTLNDDGHAEVKVTLQPEVIKSDVTVTVTAKKLKNNEASLLKQRQNSTSVSDAISAEAISRSGSSDAASAMKKVTGASIVGGKYVYIRGLGDRYANTKLNGSVLPSPDPEKQAFPMDIIPAGLLDNIVVEKTFTPDKPGNFAGGSINLDTKELPGQRVISFSSSAGYSTQATGSKGFLTYPGGNTDWLGVDDGSRAIPDALANPDVRIPSWTTARKDSAAAYQLDAMSKSFSDVMFPTAKSAPMNSSYALSYGDIYPLFNQNLSVLASLSYSRNYSFYENGTYIRWDLASPGAMDPLMSLDDTRGISEVLWGGLFNLQMPVGTRSKFTFDYMYDRNATSEARYLIGPFPEALPGENQDYETRVLRYTENAVGSIQLSGEHKIGNGSGVQVSWKFAGANASQDEPDFRTFSDDRTLVDFGDSLVYIYGIHSNQYSYPSRIYRNLSEHNREGSFDVTIPFRQWSEKLAKFKFGSAFLRKTREQTERKFQIKNDKFVRFDGTDVYVSDSLMGFTSDTTEGRYYRFYNYIYDSTIPGHDYQAWQEISAAYAMVELPLSQRLDLITGARFERTLMYTENIDTSGTIDGNDILPSIGLIYRLMENTNLRASYGKTLARPTLREFAPFASYEFAGGTILDGNVGLQRTIIHSYDLRWEWFIRPGEIIAVSGFYKKFINPIERQKLTGNQEIQYANVPQGKMYGAEFEVRKSLDQVYNRLKFFRVGGNLTLLRTRVDIPETDYKARSSADPNADHQRPMEGQSPYLVNLDIEYANPLTGTYLTLLYNVFGPRISSVSQDAAPDVYEQPAPLVDLVTSQKIWGALKLKAAVKNLLASAVRRTIDYLGNEYVEQEHTTGRSYSLGLGISF